MKLLAIDPGKANGIAYMDTTKKPPVVFLDTIHGKERLFSELNSYAKDPSINPEIVVVEDYINRPATARGFDHSWDKGFTHRIIGAIEHWAWQHRIEMILQQPAIKPAMYGMLGLKYVQGQKNVHHLDALVHGYKFIFDRHLLPQNEIFKALQGGK